MARKFKTDQEIVDACNGLARAFYKSHGYDVEEGYRFDRASHPQEIGMWNLAAMAFDILLDTDVSNALAEIGE